MRVGSDMATFLGRLRRDVRGNTLAIMAAALIPLIGMIGSGIDMTRVYMAQNRLRQACDAGALAGRRMLTGTTVTEDLRKETLKYFDFNFPRSPTPFFGADSFVPSVTVPKQGTLTVSAQTKIPTTIMKMFGFTKLDISATCSATQDFVGTDIVLVVDMSGSMNCTPGSTCSSNNEQSGSKMSALRAAATSLYDPLKPAQDQLHENNLRLRYGFVPYNATVNVGRIVYAKNPSFIKSGMHGYNTRVPRFRTETSTETKVISKAQCDAQNGSYQGFFGSNALGNCTITTTKTVADGYDWRKESLDVSQYITGATVNTPSTPGGKSTWAGCIEERQTDKVAIDGGTATTAPYDAWDLNINYLPDSNETRWAPWWPEVTFRPSSTSPATSGGACASQASRLREYYNARASFTAYLNSLKPQGNTYHDIGMIWGARFISPTGIFASATPETNDPNEPDNPKKLRGFNVRKYIIFMTDGKLEPITNGYTAYGIEDLDHRVTVPGGSSLSTQQTARHLQRFRMACNAAKSQDAEVWVIAFATTLTNDMKNCASDPSKAAGISTSAELIAKFQEIGSKIGSLRLSE